MRVQTRKVAARWLWLNLAVKALFVGLLLLSVFSDLERFNGKAVLARALTYPLGLCGTLRGASLVSAAWKLSPT